MAAQNQQWQDRARSESREIPRLFAQCRVIYMVLHGVAVLLVIVALALSSLTGSAFAQGGVPPPPAPGPTSNGATTTTTIHVVQKGETLFRIAQQYGTTVEAIAQANGITDVTRINVGQRLLIPNVGALPPGAASPGVPTDYIVQPGNSLLQLSWR